MKSRRFRIGDEVYTIAGDRIRNHRQGFTGMYGGAIVGFSKWKNYRAANVLKSDGTTKQFLLKNLVRDEMI